MASERVARGRVRRRRDRHGRGMRGPLVPPEVPLARTRAERFDDLVLDAVDHLEERWADRLEGVEFAVEDVPPVDDTIRLDSYEQDPVPLGRTVAGGGGAPPRVIIYRRPLEARAVDREDLAALVHDVVVEQVAELFRMAPEEIDPGYGGLDED
ncbi:MAG TPA: metallopeptidase family protein [Mycobacteriales bacterium]|nr:metallopeptidase family protein [Mycobacteriales bacterium]